MSIHAIPKKRVEKWCQKALHGDIESGLKYLNYVRNIYNEISKNKGSGMIHESDYESMNCCLCGKEMNSIHDTHNPYPLAPSATAKEALESGSSNRCCTKCNWHDVRPARQKIQPNAKKLVFLPDDVIHYRLSLSPVQSKGFGA